MSRVHPETRLQVFRPCNRASSNLKISQNYQHRCIKLTEKLNVFNFLEHSKIVVDVFVTYLLVLIDDRDDDDDDDDEICLGSSCRTSVSGKSTMFR